MSRNENLRETAAVPAVVCEWSTSDFVVAEVSSVPVVLSNVGGSVGSPDAGDGQK